ncbi:helicase-like transcription factor isoform X3 [Ostrea edulis]|nr:helicase-like transcription factor isoform X3 [Ostrea edulis]
MTEREARAPWMYLPYRYDPWNKSDSDSDMEDEMGHDDLDDEVLFGSLRGNIVGIRYYNGIVNNNEMVALERETHNKYDRNAIKVVNVVHLQVGHIKREQAAALAPIMDSGLARLEGVVPFGSQNEFSMPVDITLWGKPVHKQQTITRLERSGMKIKVASDSAGVRGDMGSLPGSSSGFTYGVVSNRRTFLTPAEVKNELDKLFESLSEGDKTTLSEPAEAISSSMYKHQKQALHWMIQRENGNQLPPFWENRNGLYFNSVTIFTTKTKPKSVFGGILADDMGLGKTLQTIALILSNFKDGKPLAVPVSGKVRQSKVLRLQQKAQRMEEYKTTPSKAKKAFMMKGNPSENIEDTKRSVCRKRKYLFDLSKFHNAVDEISDEESTDMEEESDCEGTTNEQVMLKKEDPEFMLSKNTIKLEKIASPIASRRVRRNVKKPIRYTYSSGEEGEERDSSTKRAKVNHVEKENLLEPTTARKGQKLGKGKGKQLLKSVDQRCEGHVTKSIEDTPTKNDYVHVVDMRRDQYGSDAKNYGSPNKLHTSTSELDRSVNLSSTEDRGQSSREDRGQSSSEDTSRQIGKHLIEDVATNAGNNPPVPSDNVSCPNWTTEGVGCGRKIEKEQRFCSMCGWRINTDIFKENAKMCHNKLEEGRVCENVVFPPQKFCSNCGKQLSFTGSTFKLANPLNGEKDTEKEKPSTVSSNNSLPTPLASVLNPTARPFVPGQPVLMTPQKMRSTSVSDGQHGPSLPSLPEVSTCAEQITGHELPDIDVPAPCSTPGSSKCGKFSGRTPTTGARATLIVCPLSVMSNWLDQLEDHVHENVHLDIYTYYGSSRIRDPAVLTKQDIVLTTYSTLSCDAKGDSALQKVKWLRVILDEGHAIRNPSAQQTKAIYALQAERKWVLTGTPIQNSIKDLWSLINFLQISPFTDRQWWTRAIERPLEQGNESAIKRVQHLMGAIAMRRTKNQMVDGKPIVELPDRKVFVEHVKLSEEERSVYEAMQNEGKIIVSRYFQQGTLLHHYGDILAILMRLRQMCCHPLLVAKAAAAMKDILGEVETTGGMNDSLRQKLVETLMMVLHSGSDEECAICLDSLKHPIITRCAHVFCRGCIEAVIKNEMLNAKCPLCRGDVSIETLTEVPAEQAEQSVAEVATAGEWKSSTKVDALMNGLVKLREENPGVKSLVVSQFTSLLTLLEIPLSALGFSFVRLDGRMSMKQRHRAVEEFSNPAPGSPTIMLLSLKAGGVGINLVAASRVFLMDPAWNPASEEQCFDRCHRLGQTKDVIVTKFVVEDSVEERMMALQDQKRQLMQGAFEQKKHSAEEKRTNRIRDIKTLMDL